MKIKAMGYPAKNRHFEREKSIESLVKGNDYKSIKGEYGNLTSIKDMYGNKKFFGRRKI